MFKEKEEVYRVTLNNNGEITDVDSEEITSIMKIKIKTNKNEYSLKGIDKTDNISYITPITEELTLIRESLIKKYSYIRAKREGYIPTDITRKFEVGDTVSYGGGHSDIIDEVFDNGLFYGFKEKNSYKVLPWVSVYPLNSSNEFELASKNRERISFYNQPLSSILHKIYYWNVDMNPYYQREFVWSEKDEELLIDSIFEGIEIGKFVFIDVLDDKNNEYDYEILDGKQRINTIRRFYEDRFTYKGKKFSELSNRDKNHFLDLPVSVGEVSNFTEEQKLRYFLRLNRGGKIMASSHISKIENFINEVSDK